jgi:putative transposase
MPHSFASLLVHVIFSTKNRLPVLSPELAGQVFPYMGGIVRHAKGYSADRQRSGGSRSSAPATESVAELLRVVKTNSSRWVHEQFPAQRRFGWQAGYAAFTVSNSRAKDVKDYTAAQQEHHRRVSFQEEFLAFLRKNGIAYDERDLWG